MDRESSGAATVQRCSARVVYAYTSIVVGSAKPSLITQAAGRDGAIDGASGSCEPPVRERDGGTLLELLSQVQKAKASLDGSRDREMGSAHLPFMSPVLVRRKALVSAQ